MADTTIPGLVVAGVATAVGCSTIAGFSTGSSGAIGAVVAASCYAANNYMNSQAEKFEPKEKKKKKSKSQKRAEQRRKAEEAAAKAKEEEEEEDSSDEQEEEEPEPKPLSKSALRRKKKQAAAERKKAEEAAAAAAAAAAKKKAKEAEKRAKRKAKKAAAQAATAEPEQPAKKKKNKKKKKKVVEESESEEEEPTVDEGWEVQKVKKSSSQKRAAREKSAPTPGDAASSAPVYTQELEIDSKFYGKIIGPQGSTRQAISDASGCDIQIPKKDSSGPIILSGEENCCNIAAQAINELITKGYSTLLDKDLSDSGVVVPARLHGVVIGPRGQNIKSIQEKTGCKINMPDRESSSERISVIGTPSAVFAAIEAINQLVKDGFSSLTHENWVKDSVSIPGDMVPTLIGSGGSTIKSLQTSTGAKINIPSDEARGKVVSIGLVGEASAVKNARNEILELVKPPEPVPIAAEWSQNATATMLNLW